MGKKCCFRPLDFDAVVDLDSSHEMPAADRRFIYVRVGSNDCGESVQSVALNGEIRLLVSVSWMGFVILENISED